MEICIYFTIKRERSATGFWVYKKERKRNTGENILFTPVWLYHKSKDISYYSVIFFFNTPNNTAPTIVPTIRARRYISAFPTTGTTKIPP